MDCGTINNWEKSSLGVGMKVKIWELDILRLKGCFNLFDHIVSQNIDVAECINQSSVH